MDRDVALIVNPVAGGGRTLRTLPRVEDALRAHGVRFHVELTRDLAHAAELARAAGEAGEVAAAYGGDGLLGTVAGALPGTDGVLAIVPGGRGNDFARGVGVPRDPVAACATVARGRERAIDVGEAVGVGAGDPAGGVGEAGPAVGVGAAAPRRFVGIASCGFDSDVNRIANAARIPGGAVYLYAALRALAGWRAARFALELDGERVDHVGFSVAAANGSTYGAGMVLAPDARVDDGAFDVVTIADVSRRRFLAQLPKVFRGRHVANPEVVVRRARELRIASDRPFTLYGDGEPLAELPATVRTLPGAVRLLVPA